MVTITLFNSVAQVQGQSIEQIVDILDQAAETRKLAIVQTTEGQMAINPAQVVTVKDH